MLVIPSKFELLLKKDLKLEAIVKNILSDYGDILEENQLFFFEEYTDHGVKHIQQVLNASEDIITELTIENILNTEDVFILILSIILHDLGMHTSFATFKAMLDGEYDNVRVETLDYKKWIELWNDYLDEAKKFSGKQRVRIFGDETQPIKEPDLKKKDNLTGYDRKLIGEFIRRNHPRIAHEIALKGLLGNKGQLIPFAENLEERLKDYKDIAGIVARSHGMAIRDCFDYLQKFSKDEWAQPFSINVVFLMVVIRIADYFQFNAERVSSKTIKLKTFSSPVSEIEFIKHESIKFVKPFVRDNETLHVEATPPSSFVFVKLLELFKDIQKELDLSWAIIGEIYGREKDILKPQLKYRRIKSNLDDKNNLLGFSFVAEKISFIIDEDLPKLLIAPLYGNNPSFGVRELLQNAIDACRERARDESKLGNEIYQGLVNINISKSEENGKKIFLIKDNGKGMSLFELKNYFLKAGASFRKSNEWKRKYEDIKGSSSILRSGRFGIGVLAAFLIGEELTVQTRGINDSFGYKFTTQLDTEQIELEKVMDAEIGTSIIVPISSRNYNTFTYKEESVETSFDFEGNNSISWMKWYTLNNPNVIFKIDETNFVSYKNPDPSLEDKEPLDWRSFNDLNFDLVRWTYSKKYTDSSLTCNGITIPSGFRIERDYGLQIRNPKVSIFDSNANLNLSLSRNELVAYSLPFENELVIEIFRDLISFIFLYTPKLKIENGGFYAKVDHIIHPSISPKRYSREETSSEIELLYLKDGFILKNDYCLSKVPYSTTHTINIHDSIDENNLINIPNAFELIDLNFVTSDSIYATQSLIDPDPNGRVIAKKTLYNKMFDKSKPTRSRIALRKYHIIEENSSEWIIYKYRYNEPLNFKISDLSSSDLVYSIIETKINKVYKKTVFNSLLELYFKNDPIIPYDLEERKNKFSFAFQKLSSYMKQYL